MSFPFALVVTINWVPSGEKATCPGVLVNWGVAAGFRPRARVDPTKGEQTAKGHRVALDRAAVLCVEHVDQVAVHGHADWERAPRAHYLAQAELISPDTEDRHRVAAGVHCVEQVVVLVVGERALRRQVVDHRPGEDAAQPTRRVGTSKGEHPIAGPLVGDDLVARDVVGLDEDGVIGAAPEGRSERLQPLRRWPGAQALMRQGPRRRRGPDG